MLLKMFAISCFVRAGREERPHEHGVRKLWSAPALPDGVFDEGFHEDESIIALDNIGEEYVRGSSCFSWDCFGHCRKITSHLIDRELK